ncbi:SDR family NAD(P)-dependent oxidoreductase [Microbulbifer sp. PSTR4-B]|uniref:SDR family NAD(P)-dependent oxidoreductase n=1 Tax=Microbulbifer sp. PSTR4-B TaxID=3243396 RepID=UPI00403964BA
MIKSVLITGANAGLGRECAKQLAEYQQINKIYLGCRNLHKAKETQTELVSETGRNIFEVLLIDVADQQSVKEAVKNLDSPVDALVMNAGGTGGKEFYNKTPEGVTQIFAVNLLGHALLTNELLKANKLTQTAIYAGSEAARGVKEMGMKRPDLKSASVEEFMQICEGKLYASTKDATVPYGPIKYMGALWMSSMAREFPHIRFVTMSPGATVGTEGFNTLSLFKQYMMKGMMQIMLLLGKVHKVEIGAKRYIDALLDTRSFRTGIFYGSERGLTGPLGEQRELFPDLDNPTYQDNAKTAINRFI